MSLKLYRFKSNWLLPIGISETHSKTDRTAFFYQKVSKGKKNYNFTLTRLPGGKDLIFPHHECEIAQAVASQGDQMVRYWMHNNMITINGQKMGKSLGNFITLEQFFIGNHDQDGKALYRRKWEENFGPTDFSFDRGDVHSVCINNCFFHRGMSYYSPGELRERLMNGLNDLERVPVAKQSDEQVKKFGIFHRR